MLPVPQVSSRYEDFVMIYGIKWKKNLIVQAPPYELGHDGRNQNCSLLTHPFAKRNKGCTVSPG
jgi:hypothetical protein